MTDDERFVADLFKRRYGLVVQKIPESASSSPDFEIYSQGDRIVVAELKTVEDSCQFEDSDRLVQGRSWLVITRKDGSQGAIPDDSSVSRIRTRIHAAWKQLRAWDGPRAVIFLNSDPTADAGHMQTAVIGLGYFADDKGSLIVAPPPSAAADRIAEEKDMIDVYIWIDRPQGDRVSVLTTTETGEHLAESYFPDDETTNDRRTTARTVPVPRDGSPSG